jgi:hypothetical protein
VRFILRGEVLELNPYDVKTIALVRTPEPVRKHYVEVGGKHFPPKQLLEQVLLDKGFKDNEFNRLDFTTIDARSILKRLGFRCGEV